MKLRFQWPLARGPVGLAAFCAALLAALCLFAVPAAAQSITTHLRASNTNPAEGETVTFTVTLSSAATSVVHFQVGAGGTAENGPDFTVLSVPSIPAGGTTATFQIKILRDAVRDPGEHTTFSVDQTPIHNQARTVTRSNQVTLTIVERSTTPTTTDTPTPTPTPTQTLIGSTACARAFALPGGGGVRLEPYRSTEPTLTLTLSRVSADGRSAALGSILRQAAGQTYIVVRRPSDGRIVRRWVPPYSPLVDYIPWSTLYTVPTCVLGAIPLDEQALEPNQLVRRFDGSDTRVFSYDAALRQWRWVPNIATFQALGFYWCDVTAADRGFFARLPVNAIGPAHPVSAAPARADYPDCR